jgi:hypothetical protein
MDYGGFIEEEAYREGLNKGLEFVEKRNSNNRYADLRELGTITQEDQEWTSEEWFPRAMDRARAHGDRPSRSGRRRHERRQYRHQLRGIRSGHVQFDDPEDGQEWLEEQSEGRVGAGL